MCEFRAFHSVSKEMQRTYESVTHLLIRNQAGVNNKLTRCFDDNVKFGRVTIFWQRKCSVHLNQLTSY